MSSAGTILDAIKKIEQNRALARRRRVLLRQLGEKSIANLDYKSDPNRVEMTAEAKEALKNKMRNEIRWEQRRDWFFVGLGILLFACFLYLVLF